MPGDICILLYVRNVENIFVVDEPQISVIGVSYELASLQNYANSFIRNLVHGDRLVILNFGNGFSEVDIFISAVLDEGVN